MLDERARMAREIHDTIAHGLTGIVTQLEAAEQAEDRPGATGSVTSTTRPPRSREPVRGAALGRGVAPEALERRDLSDALGEVASSGRDPTASRSRSRRPGARALHPEIEVALLRTAQEALANVAQHARATRAGVTLSYMGDVVTLDVRDDGVGFEVSRTRR